MQPIERQPLTPLHALFRLEIPYIDMQALETLLHQYKNPKAYVARLVQQGDLIRLKGGFFLIRELIQKKLSLLSKSQICFMAPPILV